MLKAEFTRLQATMLDKKRCSVSMLRTYVHHSYTVVLLT